MRILILSQYFWPETFRINALVDALQEIGADVTVLTGQPNYPDGAVFPGYRAASARRERYGNVDVFRVPIIPRGRASAVRLAANYLSFVVSAAVVGAWLLRGRPVDVILVYAPSPITQAIPAMLLKRIKGAKLVTWVQDLWPESLESTGFVTNSGLLGLAGDVVRGIYADHDLLLGQSRAFVAAIRPLAEGTPVEYFPNPGEATAREARRPALVLKSGFNVVFAGNLGTVQALETVLDAAELLRADSDIRFVLAGSGSKSAWLASEVVRRGLSSVSLPGRFDHADVSGILSQASALLVSLNKDRILSQTIPAKVQTYLSAGIPIIASLDGEGADLVVQSGAGFAAPAEDAGALAACVRRMKDLPEADRRRMGEAGREYHDRHFRPRVLAERLLDRFAALIAD